MDKLIGVHAASSVRTPLEPVIFQLPQLPMSVNSLYQILWSTRRVELKPEARRFKSDMKRFVPRYEIADTSFLRIDFIFHYPFLYQNLKLRVFDSSNLCKLTLDCICERLGVNDSRVKSGSWQSVDDEQEFVEVVLTEVAHGTTN